MLTVALFASASLMWGGPSTAVRAASAIREGTMPHEGWVTGAVTAWLGGSAVFGANRNPALGYSISLGAADERGAVLLSRLLAGRPAPGTYAITTFRGGQESPRELHAFIALGSVEKPLGAFHAVAGSVTITTSTPSRITGHYSMRAIGWLANKPEDEDREIRLSGNFQASAIAAAGSFDTSLEGGDPGAARAGAREPAHNLASVARAVGRR